MYLSKISILVDDYDEALSFYIDKLGFVLVEDRKETNKRWIEISPSTDSQCKIVLAKAKNEEEKSRIGNQTGGRVFLFLETNNFEQEFNRLKDNNVTIVRQPKVEDYGKVLVFADLYGNLWDLIQTS